MRISDWSSDVCSSDLREFGTVGGGIAASANVSGVMKQRDQHAEHTAMRAESLRSRHAALMSVDQARHRQRTVEAVLGVVVPGVAAGIAGQGARVQAAEGLERDRKSTRLNSSH